MREMDFFSQFISDTIWHKMWKKMASGCGWLFSDLCRRKLVCL